MTRHHLRAGAAVMLDYFPLVLSVVGAFVALVLWHMWPHLAQQFPFSATVVILVCLCLGLCVALLRARHALRRRSLCGGPRHVDGLVVCPILAAGRPGAVVPEAQRTSRAQPMLRVLVVEDDALTRHVMARVLEQAGCEVEATDDGAQALYILGHERPDVMVLDLMLPTLDGPQVARTQRQLKEAFGQRTRIIVVTGDTSAQDEAWRFGADAFLVKPVDGATLVRTVVQLGRGLAPVQQETARE